VPGDISSAAFFLCAAALFPGSSLVLDSLGLNPTRATLLDVLTALGAHIGVLNWKKRTQNLWARFRYLRRSRDWDRPPSAGRWRATDDELPVIAAMAPFTSGGIRIRDARELRVKESDRIALAVKNLRAMGAEVTEFEDGLDVPGGRNCTGLRSTPAATTASPWLSAWQHCAPRARR